MLVPKVASQILTAGFSSPQWIRFAKRLICYDAFRPKKVVVLTKTTRYEFEKTRLLAEDSHLSESALKERLLAKGSNYHELKKRHDRHLEILNHVIRQLREHDIEPVLLTRQEYTEEAIKVADAVFSAGGDGTFLLAASKMPGRGIPLVGVNTDPERSEGYLCLPRKFSLNFSEALHRLLSGKFRWLWRNRIRITLSERHTNEGPVELNSQTLAHPEDRFVEHVREHEIVNSGSRSGQATVQPARVLPVLALNDIFIGESLSARVSFYEMCIDDAPNVKQKSSGLAVCTGTGSSSWYFNINYMQKQNVREVLKIASEESAFPIDYGDKTLLDKIADRYNTSLRFDPMDLKVAYTIRDPVHSGIFQVSNPRGFARRIAIRSRMWDASIVVDGGVSFPFNDGAKALLEIHETDALRSVLLPE